MSRNIRYGRYKSPRFVLIAAFGLFSLLSWSAIVPTSATESIKVVELGDVSWLRDFEAAKSKSKREQKPLLVLFTEVPGCSTVRGYGKNVLSHPDIVEAANNLFVPVAVFNNVGGNDRQVLKTFKEPAWNNPVVRIMDANIKALSPRLAGNYSVKGLANAMAEALSKVENDIPSKLSELAGLNRNEQAFLSMHCFWEGEAKIGKLHGVRRTRPGFVEGAEVVEVTYNPQRISYESLVKKAHSLGVATKVFTRSNEEQSRAGKIKGVQAERSNAPFRYSKKDDKYYLQRSSLKNKELTPEQSMHVNAALAHGEPASPYLTP